MRISARGLDSTTRADILPVRSRASLVNKRFIVRLKKALKVFHKQGQVQYLANIGPAIEHFDWLILVIGPVSLILGSFIFVSAWISIPSLKFANIKLF